MFDVGFFEILIIPLLTVFVADCFTFFATLVLGFVTFFLALTVFGIDQF